MNKLKTMKIKGAFWTIFAFYFLIALEFFYMASPFAMYFYSVYRPSMKLLDQYPSISWTAGFFLPHIVEEVKSTWLNYIDLAGILIAAIGLLTFIICAAQIYYAKLKKKGAVTGGLYKIIRHPQYTAFAICSFGLALVWPRYLSLIMFITMLFGYYLLARLEEKECERKFGEPFKKYISETNMFFYNPFKKINISKRFNTGEKILTGILLYCMLMFGGLAGANMLKEYSVEALYKHEIENVTYLSLFEAKSDLFNSIDSALRSNSKVLSLFEEQNIEIINYILPYDMYISEIPMTKPYAASCHIYSKEYNMDTIRVVISKAQFPDSNEKGNTLYNCVRAIPLTEVIVNTITYEILEILAPNKIRRYKNMPEPIF